MLEFKFIFLLALLISKELNIKCVSLKPSFIEDHLEDEYYDYDEDEHVIDSTIPIFDEDGISFFDFAESNTNRNTIKNQLSKSINSCKLTATKTKPLRSKCSEKSFQFSNFHDGTSRKIFEINSTMIGLISDAYSMLSFFLIENNNNKFGMKPLNRQYFTNEIPFDACTDNSKSIFIVFSAQNEIAKFILNEQNVLVKMKSLIDTQFVPSAITCLKQTDEIYISEHSTNQIRIYDTDLILKKIINLNGVVYSANNALAVDKNIKLFLDGNDGVALFDENNNTCHFYQNKMCIEDIDVYFDKNNKSFIYITNSCTKSIKRFVYENDKKIRIDTDFRINSGLPVNSIINSFNQMFVLTNNPSRIYIMDLKKCFFF
jgi:hypothetical protein